MLRRILNVIASVALILPFISYAASIEGKWCQDGQPYTCYPPVQHDADTYICTNSTTITNNTSGSLEWVVNQTLHYYTDGLTNGKTKDNQVRFKFTRSDDALQVIYKNTTEIADATQERSLVIGDDSLNLELLQIPDDKDAPQLNQKTVYARCDNDKLKYSYYTALIDCGGSGDFIAGVPAVVDNPLLWAPWDINNKSGACRVAARCWGGGWVAFAYSKDNNDSNTAFGAACGGSSRHDAKQQAINTCKQSGGNNCLYQVLSGYDGGAVDGIDSANKGSKLESCYYGNCEKLRD
ncbi:hypothetical protein [Kaarinaea lacus]